MFDDEKELNSQSDNVEESATGAFQSDTEQAENINSNEETANFDLNQEGINENQEDINISQESVDFNQENINTSQESVDSNQENNQTGSYYQSGSYNSSQGNGNYSQQVNNEGTYYNQSNGYTGNQGSYYNSNNSYYNNSNNNKDNKKTVAIISAVVVSVIVIIAGVYMVTSSLVKNADETFDKLGKENTTDKTVEKEYPTIGSTVTDREDDENSSVGGVIITDVSDVVEDVMPSIVAITSTTIVESQDMSNYWPFGGYGEDFGQEEEQVGAGSGIVVKQTDSELLIVTNNHVVSGADSLSIQFVNGTSIKGVTKSTDEEADIAIVSIALSDIDSDTLGSIKIATLGSSDALGVGDGVVAIGNALGYGQSVTTGVISAKEREIQVDNQTMVVLQTDAAINGGNSGGALINSKGEVIGINVAKYSSSSYSGAASVEGMGFAIPISQATDIINNLMTKETRNKVEESKRGALGIQGVDVDATVSAMYSLPQGIYIKEVIEGGAAEKAGLRATDVITKFDGQSVSSMASLQDKLQYYKAGEKVIVTIQRNAGGVYDETEVEITLSSSSILEEQETK